MTYEDKTIFLAANITAAKENPLQLLSDMELIERLLFVQKNCILATKFERKNRTTAQGYSGLIENQLDLHIKTLTQ